MNTYLVTTSVFKRIWLLDEPEQRSLVEECFNEKIRHLSIQVHIYVVMPNHCHFVLDAYNRFQLSRYLQHLKGYSGHVFKKTFPKLIEGMEHDRLWTRRFHALLLPDPFAIERAIKYVANNPAKAALQANQYTLSPQPSPMVYAMGRCIKETETT